MDTPERNLATRFDFKLAAGVMAITIISVVTYVFTLNEYQKGVAEQERIAAEQVRHERAEQLGVKILELVNRTQDLASAEEIEKVLADLIVLDHAITAPEMRPLLLARYGSRASEVIKRADEFLGYEKAAKVIAQAAAWAKELQARYERAEEQLADLRRENKQQAFVVSRRFGMDASGKSLYEAYDVVNVRKCVLAAATGEVQNIGNLMQTELYVKFAGDLPYQMQKYNTFQNFQTTEYVATYVTTDAEASIRRLAEQFADLRRDLAAANDRAAQSMGRQMAYLSLAHDLASLLDDRYTTFAFAEKAKEVLGPGRGIYKFKDGELNKGMSGHGDRIFMFSHPGMTLDEARRYARLMGAKDEHFANVKKKPEIIKYYGKNGGVSIFLENGVVDRVMYWIPETLYQQGE